MSRLIPAICLIALITFSVPAWAGDLRLEDLIAAALKGNYDIMASRSGIEAAQYRIPQAKSLPDPMLMAGYQNEGLSRYTYGEMQGSQWMFSASQTFPFWGKRGLKGEMAEREAGSLTARHRALQLKTVAQVTQLYFDLFLAYKDIDLIKDNVTLFSRIEDIAVARYGAGRAMQQEVLMAQTEKYMLLEKEEMQRQKMLSMEAMLQSVLGGEASKSPGRPVERPSTVFAATLEDLLQRTAEQSPEILSQHRMIEGAEAKVKMAQKDFLPDVTITAGAFPRAGDYENMYSLTATFNVPLFFKSRQEPALQEARAVLRQSKQELDAITAMTAAAVRDNYAMIRSSEKLMALYRDGLIPKSRQDYDLALSGYSTGGTDAIVPLTRLKNLLDYEFQYWMQYVEREKAIARLKAIVGEE